MLNYQRVYYIYHPGQHFFGIAVGKFFRIGWEVSLGQMPRVADQVAGI